ncbi:hypothetical protein S245_032813, partial [Arachis hypogaea]
QCVQFHNFCLITPYNSNSISSFLLPSLSILVYATNCYKNGYTVQRNGAKLFAVGTTLSL